jgi:CHAT domain-containing protein
VVGRAAGDAVTFRPAWHELTQLDAAGAKTLVIRTCDTLSATVWPLVERIVHDQADALLLMPGRGLNVLPLHAAETSDGRLAMDRWSVRYAPSLALLARAGAPGSLDATRTLGQAVNPTRDLSFADAEAASIARRWTGPRRDPLTGPYAQPDRVLRLFDQADALHFAGHAAFDPDDPLRSRLVCAPNAAGDTITLQTLLERTTAVRTRVVLLSACETGRVMAEDPLNDQLGLPGGLLIAGASAVLATFWRVYDLAACLVVSKCVELWEQESIDLERALARSQEWLRTRVTVAVVRDWLDERLADRPANRDALHQARQSLATRQDGDLVFSSPLYWAPFHVTGRAMRVRS